MSHITEACAALESAADDIITELVTEKIKYMSGFTSLWIHLKVSHPHILEGIFKKGELSNSMKKDIEIAMKMSKLTLE